MSDSSSRPAVLGVGIDRGGATADGDPIAVVAVPCLVKGVRGVAGGWNVFVRIGPIPLGVPFARARALPTALMCFFPTL